MAVILWGAYQEEHITMRHGVSAEDFDEAWHDPQREEIDPGMHPQHGPYFRSLGYTDDGSLLEMVWRWQDQRLELDEVWPITAYFVEED